jgi:small subunit ribosomal protein S16
MVRIRLRRVGAKKQPSYRVVAADKESPRDGRFIENLGFYNPRTEPATIQLHEDRIYDWLGKGAQMSDAAEKVLQIAGLLDRYERYKTGESLEVLLEEARAAEAERNIDPKTKRQAPEKSSKKAKRKTETEPTSEKLEEPESEAETEAEEVEEITQEVEEPEEPKEAEEIIDEIDEVSDEAPAEVLEEQEETEEDTSDIEPEEEQADSVEAEDEDGQTESEDSESDKSEQSES